MPGFDLVCLGHDSVIYHAALIFVSKWIVLIMFFPWSQSKLKESQYQLAPWRTDLNQSNIVSQSPSHSTGAALVTAVCS